MSRLGRGQVLWRLSGLPPEQRLCLVLAAAAVRDLLKCTVRWRCETALFRRASAGLVMSVIGHISCDCIALTERWRIVTRNQLSTGGAAEGAAFLLCLVSPPLQADLQRQHVGKVTAQAALHRKPGGSI